MLCHKPIAGISTMRKMIILVQESPTEFTNVHPEFARLCFKAKCFQHSLPILSAAICSFHTERGAENDRGSVGGRDDHLKHEVAMYRSFKKQKEVN
jgi:hypothetical protein